MDQSSEYQLRADEISKNIQSIALDYVREPLDEVTRLRFRSTVAEYLDRLKATRCIWEYNVICDDRNNTACDLEDGYINIDVELKFTPVSIIYFIECRMKSHNGLRSRQELLDNLRKLAGVTTPYQQHYRAAATAPSHGGYPAVSSGSVGNVNSGTVQNLNLHTINVTRNGNPIGATVAQGPYTYTGETVSFASLERTGKLPTISFGDNDEDGKHVMMQLAPEPSIAPSEMMKIVMMLEAARNMPSTFSTYKFIKENNLERHFKFTA